MSMIAVGQSKGGVGKTTIAVNLAAEIAHQGRSVTLIDADPQESATQWSQPGKLPFPVRSGRFEAGTPLIWVRDALKVRCDFTVVDLPAGLDAVFETAVLISDLLLVPCGPSSIDLSAAQRTLAKAREVRRREPTATPFKMITVATRIERADVEGQQIGDALMDLGEPTAPPVNSSVLHARAFAEGVAISGMPGAAGAIDDVRRLTAFVLRQIAPRQTFRVG